MENQRIRLTKQMISNSLLELMRTKDVENITVTELCRKAGINRTTFYKYYQTPPDVLQDVEKHTRAAYAVACSKAKTRQEQLTSALEHAVQNLDRARLLNNETNKQLTQSAPQRTSTQDIFYQLLAGQVPEPMRLYARHMTSAAMTLWLHASDRMAATDFARLLIQVCDLCAGEK